MNLKKENQYWKIGEIRSSTERLKKRTNFYLGWLRKKKADE